MLCNVFRQDVAASWCAMQDRRQPFWYGETMWRVRGTGLHDDVGA